MNHELGFYWSKQDASFWCHRGMFLLFLLVVPHLTQGQVLTNQDFLRVKSNPSSTTNWSLELSHYDARSRDRLVTIDIRRADTAPSDYGNFIWSYTVSGSAHTYALGGRNNTIEWPLPLDEFPPGNYVATAAVRVNDGTWNPNSDLEVLIAIVPIKSDYSTNFTIPVQQAAAPRITVMKITDSSGNEVTTTEDRSVWLNLEAVGEPDEVYWWIFPNSAPTSGDPWGGEISYSDPLKLPATSGSHTINALVENRSNKPSTIVSQSVTYYPLPEVKQSSHAKFGADGEELDWNANIDAGSFFEVEVVVKNTGGEAHGGVISVYLLDLLLPEHAKITVVEAEGAISSKQIYWPWH